MLYQRYSAARDGERSTALVVRIEEKEVAGKDGAVAKKQFPVIAYHTRDGLPVFSEVTSVRGTPSFRVGDELNILYSSKHPEQVVLDQSWVLKALQWLTFIIGLTLTGAYLVTSSNLF